ncbi:MAG TPA: flagellar type III secretion system pore protein FliP, partial [Candidatus Acidoferrum sp.]|nr:flagellar type III secretion system pore protein FliP [Candidatus Acidoferrum sp.]
MALRQKDASPRRGGRATTWGRPYIALIAGIATLLTAGSAWAQSISLDVGDPSLTGRIVQIVLLMTVLSVAPSILMMVTSFTRIVVVLSLLRSALGLQQSPPNAVLIGLALFLTAYIMGPTLEASWRDGVQPLIDNQITEEQGFERASEPIRAFMESHVRDKDLRLFIDLGSKATDNADSGAAVAAPEAGADPKAGATAKTAAEAAPLRALVPAFMLSELRRAFEIGFLLFLPFLIIDMVIAAILTSMGMMMLPPLVVSLPFKLIFF